MFLYSLAIYLLTPIVLLLLFARSRREPEYRTGWWRRLAIGQKKPSREGSGRVWFHAVSVGEVLAAAPIIEQLMAQRDCAVLITTTTPTGAREVQRLFGERVDHAWAPIDAGLVVRRFFNHWRPELVALVETEVWPNIVSEAKGRSIPVLLVNARMSKRSARGYAKFGCVFSSVFNALDCVVCHGRADVRRLVALGVRPSVVAMVESVKFEIDAKSRRDKAASMATELSIPVHRPVVVAGSIHPEEQSILLDAMALLWIKYPAVLFVIAPRHLHNVKALTQALTDRGVDYVLRSGAEGGLSNANRVVVLDTYGELGSVYALAITAIIGGTLFDRGGHNPLEAIALGVPVIVGHSTFNFAHIYKELTDIGCCQLVVNSTSLAAAVEHHLDDPQNRETAASAGLHYFAARSGSARKQVDLIASFMEEQIH